MKQSTLLRHADIVYRALLACPVGLSRTEFVQSINHKEEPDATLDYLLEAGLIQSRWQYVPNRVEPVQYYFAPAALEPPSWKAAPAIVPTTTRRQRRHKRAGYKS